MAFYKRVAEEHFLSDKEDDGRILTLEDKSKWEIHPSDQVIAARWFRISTILVKHTEKESHPYLLTNSMEKSEAVRARYIGEAAPSITEAA